MKEEKCCGNCCWFYGECTDGDGFCALLKNAWSDGANCDDVCHCIEDSKDLPYCFVSKKEMRHHMAVLLQANRYRRDDHVPAIYRMPDPKELGRAIDFSYRYMKVFSEL